MDYFIWIFYGIIIGIFILSFIYMTKHIEMKHVKSYSIILLFVAFFCITIVGYCSVRGTINISSLKTEMQNYTQAQMWQRYVTQQNITAEKNSIIRYQIISILILICHLEYIYLLNLKCRNKAIEDKRKFIEDKREGF